MNKDNSFLDILNNIFFIAGATTFANNEKWNENFKICKGKIINCYSTHDKILNILFKVSTEKMAIGIGPLVFPKHLSNFHNIGFSHLEMGHSEYRHFLQVVCQRLKNELNII